MDRVRIAIVGAAGRDFHNFLVRYKTDESVEVVAFTATQIPGIDERTFPADLAGPLYPDGIPIVPESRLERLITEDGVEQAVFAYSDIHHVDVMHVASRVLAAGADFVLLGPDSTEIDSPVPVISVCAVRTGVGKSAITRAVHGLLSEAGLKAVAIRHPMPYRDLSRQKVERFATFEDLEGITLEEREEYEHLVDHGIVVFAGVDYQAIVDAAATEADVIIWDGGNNDMTFIKSDLRIVALDPHRSGHERLYHPGEANYLSADVLVINKVDSADPEDVTDLVAQAGIHNPGAPIVKVSSAIDTGQIDDLSGKRVLVIEDGPTVTHGGMPYGAGALAAERLGATELVDPRPFAVGSLKGVFESYPHLTRVLPAMGYSPEQLSELRETIAAADVDLVLIGTPIDLSRVIDIPQPTVRVTYSIEGTGQPDLAGIVAAWRESKGL